MRTAKHELRECGHCKAPMRVYHCESRNGFGKYCSEPCALASRSLIPLVAPLLPATLHEIVAATRLDPKSVLHALRTMCKAGTAHPCAIVRDTVRNAPGLATHALQYDGGPQHDPDVPVGNAKLALSFFADRMIIAAMPGGIGDLARKTGFTQSMILKRLSVMRAPVDEKGARMITHIKSWKRSDAGHGNFIGVHVAGPGSDVKCTLKRLTQQQKQKRWRKAAIRSGKLEEVYARAKAKREQKAAVQNGDQFINALFGAPAQRKQRQEAA